MSITIKHRAQPLVVEGDSPIDHRGPISVKDTSSVLIPETRAKPGRSSLHYLVSTTPAILSGIVIGILLAPPYSRQTITRVGQDPTCPNVERLSTDEIQTLIKQGLASLEDRQARPSAEESSVTNPSDEHAAYSWKDADAGFENTRRLLPSAKRWTIEVLQEILPGLNLSDLQRVTRLIDGVSRVARSEHLRGMAAVRDDRLSEVLVDPAYASYLSLDDEAVFVLAHELTHVAARSGKLDWLIDSVAESANRIAHVQPAIEQKEDLTCDYVGELVLKRFIARNPTSESVSSRVARIFGYESPAERFAHAWEDFCASYNGDPGDESHLTQYQTIRALLALDPQLQSIMPMLGDLKSASAGACR